MLPERVRALHDAELTQPGDPHHSGRRDGVAQDHPQVGRPLRRPKGALRIGLRVGLPLLVSWAWALLVLFGLPQMIRAPLPAVLMGLPDLGYPLVASAVFAFGWGLVRVICAIRTLRTPPPDVAGPAEQRHPYQLSPIAG
jgi:uncharacterized membrane protein YccC